MNFNIIVTAPAPVRTVDRAEGIPANVLVKVFDGVRYSSVVSKTKSWAINKLSPVEYERLTGILGSLACDDTFQVGQYSVHLRTQ